MEGRLAIAARKKVRLRLYGNPALHLLAHRSTSSMAFPERGLAVGFEFGS